MHTTPQVTRTPVRRETTNLQVHSLPLRPSCSDKTHLPPFTAPPQADHFGPTGSQLFSNFCGEAKVALSQGGRGYGAAGAGKGVGGATWKREGLYPYAWALRSLEEQLPEAEPQRAQSCGQAAATQLIELGWPGPATRATRVRSATRPSRRRRLLGAKGRIEGGRHPRLSPCPRQPLPLEIIPLSRGLCGALGAGIPNWTATP